MRGKIFSAAIILLVFGGSFLGKGRLNRPPSGKVRQAPDHCRRIVSMAPSITETLFALGLGDRVVGVTRYCSYPTEAKELPRIGGYLDPNFEAIVALKPDLVVMLIENEQSLPAFAKLGMTSLSVCHQNVDGILDSLLHIGQACDAEETARSLAADLQARMGRVRRKTAGLQRPRVLCAIERTLGSGTLEDVYVAGTNGFFDKIITLAGGRNAYRGQAAAFPVVSSEGILEMNPQVIFDMVPGLAAGKHDMAKILDDWQGVEQVEAVASGQVHAVEADYAFVPGPRFILLIEELAQRIHPEVDWDAP